MSNKSGKDPNRLFDDVLKVISSNTSANKKLQSSRIERGIENDNNEMTTRYNTRIPTQIQGKQRPPTTESSFELEKGHCFYSSTEGEARATSKTNRPKAKSKIRMFSDSGPSESINIDQASSVMYFERGRGATMPKQGTNVPCTISLDREEPLISLCDDIEEVGTEQMHEQEDLIDLENSYFLKDAEIGKTALKTKDPDRSLMSSKYAPVPTGCNVVTEPSRKVIEERTEKYGIETTSLLDDLDILTIPDTGLNCVPPPMHQSERKDDSTHCIEKSSSLDADSRWVTNAARHKIRVQQDTTSILGRQNYMKRRL